MSTLQTLPQVTQPRTAHLTKEALEVESDLPKGAVRIRYSCHQWNEMLQRRVAVYACYRSADLSSRVGTFYANALERFHD